MVSPFFRFLAAWGLLVASMPPVAGDPGPPPGTELRVPGERPLVECPGLVPQFRRWSRTLGLDSWRVQLVCGMHPREPSEVIGLTWRSVDGPRRAFLWIRPGLGSRQEQVVVHELAHLMADAVSKFATDAAEEAWVRSLTRSAMRSHRQRLATRSE